MDHSEATVGHAVERYLLGDMTEPEAEAFELHFFECKECTEELASGAILAENIRAVAVPEAVQRAVPAAEKADRKQPFWMGFAQWWRRPMFAAPAFAAVALAFTVVYQARELARMHQPQVLLAYNLKAASRGAANQIRIPAEASYFALSLDLPDNSFSNYRCDLYDASSRLRFSVDSPAPPAGAPLSILVSVRNLSPGDYTLRVHGLRNSQAGPELARYPFEAVAQ